MAWVGTTNFVRGGSVVFDSVKYIYGEIDLPFIVEVLVELDGVFGAVVVELVVDVDSDVVDTIGLGVVEL